jgi:ankyrin repeat protein
MVTDQSRPAGAFPLKIKYFSLQSINSACRGTLSGSIIAWSIIDETKIITTHNRICLKRGLRMSLIRASAKGDLASVKKIVNEGTDVNLSDPTGRTPLIEAAWAGHVDVVKYLLDKGANPNTSDSAGFTPLMRAAEEGNTSICSILIQKGADVNVRGKVRGTTPLMLAAEKGSVKILELLIQSGAKVNAVDQFEETALARAYRTSQNKAAEFLESKGGRGKPERSSYSPTDKELRTISKSQLPLLNAGGFETGLEEEERGGGGGGGGDDESYEE